MTADHLVILADGFALGFDAAVLLHFGGRIWDDHKDRRALARATAALDARQARQGALVGGEGE